MLTGPDPSLIVLPGTCNLSPMKIPTFFQGTLQRTLLLIFLFFLIPGTGRVQAGEADVVNASASRETGGAWSFSVTLRHDDEGWNHYADRWEVIGPGGEVLGVRVLAHPHVEEQPFTRNLSGVRIPVGVRKVLVRARDSVHGYGGMELVVVLPGE